MAHHLLPAGKTQGFHSGGPLRLHGNAGCGNLPPACRHTHGLRAGTAQGQQYGIPQRHACSGIRLLRRATCAGLSGLCHGRHRPGQTAGGCHAILRQPPGGHHVHGRQPQRLILRADAGPAHAHQGNPPVHHFRRQPVSPPGPGPSGRESPHLRHHRGNGANTLYH